MLNKTYPVDVQDIEYLRHGDKPLLARTYIPQGDGPFPALIELHGGAWALNDRTSEVNRHQALAKSGIVIVALDFRQGEEGAYPLGIADINYAMRWTKANAAKLRTRPDLVGIAGQSSGGHLAMLVAMRPHDPRYTQIPLPAGSPDVDASACCVVMSWPVINPSGRYKHGLREQAKDNPPAWTGTILPRQLSFWQSVEAMEEGNPMLAAERGEKVETPPALWVQPNRDQLHDYQPVDSDYKGTESHRFVEAYRKAGGQIDLIHFDAPWEHSGQHPTLPEDFPIFVRMIEFVHQHVPVKG